MRRFRSTLVAACLALATPAGAQEPAPSPQDPPLAVPDGAVAPAESGDTRLDTLFARLAEAESAAEARGIAMLIQRRWLESGSDTADLLMRRAQRAMGDDDPELAIEILDRILVLEPEWAEAWNRRAVAFTQIRDPVSAIADIYRVVSLEPRHFGAWAGLGGLLLRSGDERGALESFERALALNPHQPQLDAVVNRLRRDVDGVDL